MSLRRSVGDGIAAIARKEGGHDARGRQRRHRCRARHGAARPPRGCSPAKYKGRADWRRASSARFGDGTHRRWPAGTTASEVDEGFATACARWPHPEGARQEIIEGRPGLDLRDAGDPRHPAHGGVDQPHRGASTTPGQPKIDGRFNVAYRLNQLSSRREGICALGTRTR